MFPQLMQVPVFKWMEPYKADLQARYQSDGVWLLKGFY